MQTDRGLILELLDHLRYLPDLAPSDYHIFFPQLKVL